VMAFSLACSVGLTIALVLLMALGRQG